MERLGVLMQPQPGLADEAGGVLNPASARGRDGQLYLFPRLVAAGNYSRIGIARVIFNAFGVPTGVERLGTVLEPSEPYEINVLSGGGVEDPRITFMPELDLYVMAYVAYGPTGPRVALATSLDLFSWKRLGLVDFATERGADFNAYPNKDAFLFPEPVRSPDGQLALCLMHRPIYECWAAMPGVEPQAVEAPAGVLDRRPSIWLSYCPLDALAGGDTGAQGVRFSQHSLLAIPEEAWEDYRIGGGTPPLLTPWGWLTIYHGVERTAVRSRVRYCAGVLLLDRDDPGRVLYRTREPILAPQALEECEGVVSDVVFPTAIDQNEAGVDVYYGMADASIGVARMLFN
jgi:predicted GH43/DUF377 family glycosyl hydrolase